MKKNNKHQALRIELQAIAQLIGQLAEHLLKATGLMCSIGGVPMNVDERNWTFPENDYDWLATWLTTNEYALARKRKWKSESWPAYATRLSKYVGWSVEHALLQRCMTQKMGQKRRQK